LGTIALACFAITAVAGCGNSDLKRIVILTNGPDPFWDTCESGAKAAEQELALKEQGFVVDFQRGDFTDKKQIDMLKQYVIASDVVGVGISVFNPDSRNLMSELKALRDKGVAVVTIDSDVNRDKYRDVRFGYLGTDNVVGGRELGRAAAAISPEGGKYAFFVGDLGQSNAVERMAGFVEGVESNGNFTELTRLSDGGDRTKARKNVEDLLNQEPDCDMLVGIWAYNTPQIINVVQDRKIRDKTAVVCFDAAEDSIRGMGEGDVDVMVVQNPYQMGFEGVQLLHALVTDDQSTIKKMYPQHALEADRDIYRTELRVVAPDEDSRLNEALFDDSTILFKHSDFKEWLKERGLISS
jgi:ribose transport system substrate-binding protein